MEQEANIQRVPPYTSFSSFKTLIEDLRTNGLPTHIDRDVMKRFSGSVTSQLMTALRFLQLVNDENEPTDSLEILVEAREPEEWKGQLRRVIEDAYSPIMPLDLSRITASTLTKEFKDRYKSKDDVTEKCVRFFVHAAKEAGVELSPRVTNATRTRAPRKTSTTQKRKDASEQPSEQGKKDVERANYDMPPSGVTRTPIPLGLGRLAYIELPKDWKSNELRKLISMLELMLSEDVV
jgi:hypothetical protein